MDKNTITGLVLIGILLVGFSFLSRPSEEQIAAQKKYYDSIAVVQQQEEALKAKTEAALANSQKEVASAADSSALFFNALHGTDSKISIQNNVAEITFTTKGGRVYSAMLKDYMAQDKKTPVMLFDGDDASMNFNFYNKAGAIQTKDYFFEAVNKTDSSVTMRLAADSASYIDFIYTLKPDSYLMNFEIKATGMEDKLASTKYVDIDWSQRARQLEKGFTYENRLSELTYKVTGDNVDNLSAAKDDSQDLPGRIDWVAFKNQFFSSVFIAEQDFDKVSVKSKMEQQGSGYIKDYSAEMNTFFDPSGKEPTEMYFYFGPNHFKTLKALDKGRDEKWELHRLVYLGWPLIRWINQFITINVFDWLSGWGLSMGIVLLILTIMVKVLVYPATWKTYMSSAKMRVLKPKIDEINKKYPKQEDAMKKQQEVMSLYSQYGVSPMGGCLPMLLQFPILMALFMFVPSAIELRQQSFLWADDLSTYDAIITFPFHIPFLGNHLSLFCLLMTLTNILNTKYTMSMQDTGAQPQMAAMKWMMYLMPIMFLFVLNDYPSGLNYYYFVSTLISVGTMILLRRTTDETKLLAILEAKKKDPKQMKKTGFAARLEAMQKQQEQLQQQRLLPYPNQSDYGTDDWYDGHCFSGTCRRNRIRCFRHCRCILPCHFHDGIRFQHRCPDINCTSQWRRKLQGNRTHFLSGHIFPACHGSDFIHVLHRILTIYPQEYHFVSSHLRCSRELYSLACVRVLLLFYHGDVPRLLCRYDADQDADFELYCDGTFECGIQLYPDFRKIRFPAIGNCRCCYRLFAG